MTLWLSNPEATRLAGLAKKAKYASEGEFATALLNAGAEAYDRAHPPSPEVAADEAAAQAQTLLDGINACYGHTTRPEQATFHRNLRHFLADDATPDHGVLFAEAATGVGKTRAYLAEVVEWTETHPEAYAVLAYPTLATLQQAVAEWRYLGAKYTMPGHVALASQNEFVSVTALEAVLADPASRRTRRREEGPRAEARPGVVEGRRAARSGRRLRPALDPRRSHGGHP